MKRKQPIKLLKAIKDSGIKKIKLAEIIGAYPYEITWVLQGKKVLDDGNVEMIARAINYPDPTELMTEQNNIACKL